jgi:hypothetical protein
MSRPGLNTVLKLIAEDRAQILRVIETQGYETLIERFWEGISKDQLDACRKRLVTHTSAKNKNASTTVTDPMASDDAKLGEWVGGPVIERREEDGTYTLIQTLFRGNLVVQSFAIEQSCRFLIERTMYFKSPTRPVLPSTPYPAGVSYRMNEISVDGSFGTYTGWIDKRTRLPQNLTFVHIESPSESTSRVIQEGYTGALVDITQEQGKIKRRIVELNEDCSKNVQTDTNVPRNQTTGSAENSAARSILETLNTESTTIYDKTASAGTIRRVTETPTEAGNIRTVDRVETPHNQTSTSEERSSARTVSETLNTESTTIADKTQAAGTIRRVTEAPTEAGNVRTVDRVETPHNQTSTSEEHSAARDTVETLNTESTTIANKAASAGTIRRVSEVPTEAGNVRTVDRVETPKNQTSVSEEHSAADSVVETLNTESTTIADKSAATGTIRRVTETPTEAGNVRTIDRVETPIDQPATSSTDSAAASSVTSTHTEGTAVSGSASTGTIRRIDNRPTRAGNFSTTDTVITPKNQTSISREDSAARGVSETLNTESTTIGAVSAATGTIRRVSETPTEAGNVRTVDRVETPKNQTSTSREDSASRGVSETLNTEGATIGAFSASTGTIRRVSQTPTEAGNVRTVDRVETPKNQTSTSREDSAARGITETLNTESTTIANKAASAGTIRRVSEVPTEAGNVRTVDRVETPKNQTSTSREDSAARGVVETLNTEGATIGSVSAAAGTIRRVTETPTEAGNVRTIDRVETPKNQTSTSTEASAARTITETLNTEGTAIGSTGASAGTIRRVNQTPTEAGNVRTVDRVETPINQTSVSTESSASETIVETLNTEGTTIGSPSAASGTIRRVIETPTEAGNVRTVDRVITPINQVGSGSEVRHDSTTTLVTNTSADAQATPTGGAGELVKTNSTPTRAGKWDTARTVVVPTTLNQTITFKTRGRDATVQTIINAELSAIQAAASALDEDNSNSVDLSHAIFPGRWNAGITSIEPATEVVGPGTDRLNTTYPITVNGTSYTVKIVTSKVESNAVAAFAGANVRVPGLPTPGLYYRGRNVWMGIGVRVT